MSTAQAHPRTPDRRYFVVKGRLWRTSNPALAPDVRQELVDTLMQARRAVGLALKSGDAATEHSARARVDAAKIALGERGPVWWSDGAPDLNRRWWPIRRTPIGTRRCPPLDLFLVFCHCPVQSCFYDKNKFSFCMYEGIFSANFFMSEGAKSNALTGCQVWSPRLSTRGPDL